MEGILALMIPIIAIGGGLAIPIVAMMSKHQQRMAELMRQNAHAVDPRVDALQQQIAELKDLVHRQTIAIDRFATPLPGADVQERVAER